MVKTKFKRTVSLVMAAVLSLSAFANIGTTAYAASGTKSDVYIMELPRSGDTNNNGKWGHGELKFMNGWYSHAISTDSLRAMGSYSGNIAYCIEPGTGQHTGDTLTEKNEDYFNNLGSNGTISGDDIRLNIGRILQYGYCGSISTSWKSQNSDDADKLSHAIATQLLIWETIVGERDESFNHKSPGSYDAILDQIQKGHPLYSRIMAYYNSMSESVQKHTKVPSFCTKSSGSAKVNELKWDGSKYVTTLTDSNGVLGNYEFSANIDGVTFSKSGNKLTVSMTKAPSKEFTITATKTNGTRKGIVVWTDGKNSPGNGIQDVVSYSQNVSDPVSGFVKMKVSYGSCKIVKTSEDGKVDGIKFTITGNGVNQTVTTANGGKFQLDNLMPGVYTVTEQSIDKYVPQEVHRVTIVAGQVATVNFNNVLKRGNLQVIKSSEDNLVEGVKFHLYGTSLAGIAVDEYAVTDKNGVATFKDVLISGSTPYTLEEVDTAIRYVVPEKQTAPIKWNEVTNRDFTNILKKFSVTVTKSDREEGAAQGDAKLSGAVYGIYKGETLVDKYVTDSDGQFTTKEYVCDSDWTVREITPSEGYLLDKTVHKVGAEPELYTVELNSTANDVNEQVIKGNIALIKHTDNGETQIETPEEGAVFEVFLKSAGSYENAKETERDVLTCDENGFAQTKDMPYGIYTVRQTFGWEGRELMKDFDVFISKDGQTYRYLINNANFESYIKIVKKDAETGNTIPYAGAGFQIYDLNGNLVTMTFTYPEVTTIDTFYTTADGDLITPQTLEYGKGYSLVEVQAPYGYVLNSEPVYFDVVQENSEEESGITVIEVVRSNMAQKGTITVEKSGEVFSSVAGDKGLYQPIFSVSGLEGAVYEITAAEDIVTLDGTVRANKGEVVDTVTTGKDGTAKSKELYLGKYEVKEITAPYGMVLNEEVRSVELVYAGQNVDVTETATSFYNERQRVEIDLIKSLAIDEAYGIGKNGEIFDVTFGLYAAEELTAADGKTIPADGLIEVISLDESGHGKAISDLPMGSYYVQETSTNSAYIVSDAKYPVIFEYAGQDTETVRIIANEGEAITNDIIYGSVSGKKSDEDGKALGSAVIGIFKTGTTEFTKENAIVATTSKDDGSFSFAKVPYGTWIIREIESPKGYVLSEEEIAVTIGKVDEVVEIELVNYFIKGNIALTKVDEDYPDNKLSGAVFEVYSDTNGDGKLDKDDTLLGEMKELDGGVYQMSELRYGKYLVKETKAPTGFVLDENVYSVSVEENGKTYTVENKAGVGFINAAQKGSLKIVKTSSDGKVEGFSFRVTGVDYDQTFKTDKNGEIVIEGLRIGDYTVSEVSDKASAGYILPADKQATVKVDATAIVQMHNEFRDTPKTGDDFNLGLWVSLAALSVVGAGVLGFVSYKNRKKKKED